MKSLLVILLIFPLSCFAQWQFIGTEKAEIDYIAKKNGFFLERIDPKGATADNAKAFIFTGNIKGYNCRMVATMDHRGICTSSALTVLGLDGVTDESLLKILQLYEFVRISESRYYYEYRNIVASMAFAKNQYIAVFTKGQP